MIAASLGVVTPFCSRSAMPLFIGLVQAGVPLGATFSFLIAAPVVNELALTGIAIGAGIHGVVDGNIVHAGGIPARDKVERWLGA